MVWDEIEAETLFLRFEGLRRPVRLEGASKILPMVSAVMTYWPHTVSTKTDGGSAFITIRPQREKKWEVVGEDSNKKTKVWDDVNAVCDLVSEMAWERLRSEDDLLCMHAAAVNFEGRLVLFPNARRAGKSTLAIALARLGLQLFTDDFLPVRLEKTKGECVGLANGILPRLRLPVPQEFSTEFQVWADQNSGPANPQYKYIADVPIAAWGQELPLGAIIVLDRKKEATHPRLNAIAQEDALESLVTQNFARTHHAASLLETLSVLSKILPTYTLSYYCAEAAAKFLQTAPELVNLPQTSLTKLRQDDRQADFERIRQPTSVFNPEQSYCQAPNVTETVAGNDCFLADSAGVGIVRLNPTSAAIWKLLKEPIEATEVVELIAEAFPEVGSNQIREDYNNLMRDLLEAHLIVPLHSSAVEP